MPEHKPLYLYSLKEAAEWDEKDEWRESYLENCDCARAIERAIDEHYDGQRLNSCAQEIIDRYGFDRVNFVLAATVRQGTHDGRYSEDNKKWSKRFSVMDKENAWQYHVRSHTGLVNLFVADARRLWDKLGLFDGRHCENGSQVDYTDRIVVLDPSILKDECKTPQDQLFYAESGNGCRPNAIGTKVYVYFEEQGIHSIDPASEFYITIYGSIAQSESENISANVKWGKAQSAKQGNVPFQCKHFLGYSKNADGEIEIVPEEAEIIREIYERYLSGESLHGIKCYLEAKEIPTPAGCSVWRQETIRSILSNEKYKGDAIINKTYVSDCISKRIKANNGERNKYYIENNHPAIIDAGTFARVQEEIARRSGKPKVKQKGTKTELSRYSSKYALSELLICGECRTPYRRCTWTAKGKRKIVWRCINRLDYGKKYCHHSPSIEESLLQDAVMRAIMQTAKQNIEVMKTLKIHIGMGLTDEVTEDKTLDIQIRIAEIDAEFQKMLKAVSADNADGIDEERITELMNEKQGLTVHLEQYAAMRQKRESAKSRLDEIYTILDGLQNHPMEYDDKLVRQIIECVVVESKEKIKVIFIGGTEIEMTL